jgi:hypothetical protein
MSTLNVNRIADASGGVLAPISSVMRNRIINGAMAVFQRGTAATADAQYSVDRWRLVKSNDATESASQNTDAPVGFSYSLRNTISTGDATIGAGQYSGFEQSIEGFNINDLNWGTGNAKTVTLSFWIRSSVVGQYTGNLRNADDSRIYPFNFTINTANTWEFETIVITGPTDGSWNSSNGIGIKVAIYAALGSNFLGGTANAWNSTSKYGSGSPVNGIASNGNIFAISGVQLEKGTQTTGFEYRQYGTELALCQRYYVNGLNYVNGFTYNATTGIFGIIPPVTFRATPTVGYTSGTTVSVDFIGGTQNATISIAAGGAYASTKGICLAADGLSGRTTWQGIILVGDK